jgi:hypothetical protein
MTDSNRKKVIEILRRNISYDRLHDKNFLAQKIEKDKKMSLSEFMRIWNGTLPLEDISDIYLCVLYKEFAAIKFTKVYNMPDINQFFSEQEITAASNAIIQEEDIQYPITFSNVEVLNDDHYLIPMDVSLINKLQKSKLLKRDVNAQRETVIRVKNNETYEYIKLNLQAIAEIKDCLLKGKYYPDEIKFNLNVDGNEKMDYNPSTKQLTIYSGDISLIDGNHRVIAIEQAMYEDPTINIKFPVSFMHFPLWKAQDTINQQEKKQPLVKSVAESYANTTGNAVITDVMNHRDLLPECKIVKTRSNIAYGVGTFLFSSLSKAVEEAYTQEELIRFKRDTVNWIVEFLNDISYNIPDLFDKKKKIKHWAFNDAATYFYIYLSKELKNDSDWRQKLGSILSSIDFTDFSLPYSKSRSPRSSGKKMLEEYVK